MALMNDIKGDGHSLVAPRMSLGWVVYALIAVFVLAIVASVGLWAYSKVKSVAGTGKTSRNTLSDSAGTGSSTDGLGWL